MTQFSLSWDAHPKNICNGLSALQQNGEFVDMTIAADGHIVKVHQVLIALSSPYLKALINTVPCRHPVIYLHNISYKTLCYVLEYIYTGEAMVPVESINDLIVACKNLHIKGLEEMLVEDIYTPSTQRDIFIHSPSETREKYLNVTDKNEETEILNLNPDEAMEESIQDYNDTNKNLDTLQNPANDHMQSEIQDTPHIDAPTLYFQDLSKAKSPAKPTVPAGTGPLQFTISNQGSLQIILNRYLYYLKHSSKMSTLKQWRCVDYVKSRCPAYIVTNGEVVVKRSQAHTHTYHDDKILKKLQRKSVFYAISEAEKQRSKNCKGKKKVSQTTC